MLRSRFISLIILIEGYAVLACELLAIRQLIPFVGSGVEIVSIVISAVLLPLATGYHIGGQRYRKMLIKGAHYPISSVRKILLKNTLYSLAILVPGLSYPFMELYFTALHNHGITNRLLQTALYAPFFIAIPVFLLGQTVPLISNYFSKKQLSETTGRMLFFSTMGSFLGSVFSTLVLMNIIGVHNTVIVTFGLLCILGILLSRKFVECFFIAYVFCIGYLLNSDITMRKFHVISDNAYNLVRLLDDNKDGMIIFDINRSTSTGLPKKGSNKRFEITEYIKNNFINPIAIPGKPPREILIMGAGGFVEGLNDKVNHYTFVDIDGALKGVAEKYFLPEKLSSNKDFIVSSARAFIHRTDKKYDLIFLDMYTNMDAMPMECVTQDFLLEVRAALKENGILLANIVSSSDFNDTFTVRYDNTFSSVFPVHTRQVIATFNPWDLSSPNINNVLYIYYNKKQVHDTTIYTDDKNTYSLDKP